MSILSKKNNNKIVNKKATDPFDKLIFEGGIRARQVITDKKLNLLVVLLNNGVLLKLPLNKYPRLKKATPQQLNKWELISEGIGVRWEELDEDLSVKGMIKESLLSQLQLKPIQDFI